ncbi:MAG: DUF6279 family lipoprotein [Gallionella sp.]
MNRLLFVIIAFAFLSCGCSSVSLLYRNADWYLQHKIDGYATFNTRQEKMIHGEISNYLDWHRKYALPEYIIFLQNLNGVAQHDGQVKVENIAQLRAQLTSLYRTSLTPAIKPAAKILSSLDSRQIQELEQNLAEENTKQQREETDMGRDAYLDKRAYKTLNFLEGLVGNMSREQRQRVKEMSRHLPLIRSTFIEQRASNQGRLIKLLGDNAGADKLASFMSLWTLTPDATRTAQQQRDIHAFETASDEMIANIQGMLTPRQKNHLHKEISGYIDELQNLTTDKKAASGASRQQSGPP